MFQYYVLQWPGRGVFWPLAALACDIEAIVDNTTMSLAICDLLVVLDVPLCQDAGLWSVFHSFIREMWDFQSH